MKHQTKDQYVNRVIETKPISWLKETLSYYNVHIPKVASKRVLAEILYDRTIVPLLNMKMP